mmetsp:Transcript_32659/g.44852  ORF Transcript_32659/g.44852 Transcript_32659/m.44852 type:complete len:265 (-) Transcript_32659:1982-2776(-)
MSLKMENLIDIRNRFQKDVWMISLDLSKFYWSTEIAASHRKYFRFRIDGVLWQWRVLPFGFVNSMQIMARIMRPVIARLNIRGIQVLNWVDDMVLFLGPNWDKAVFRAQWAIDFLDSLGLIVHPEKTSLYPVKEVTFRAFVWNSENMTVRAPQEKLKDIRKCARSIQCSRVKIKELATLVGKVRYLAQIHTHLVAWIVESQILIKETVKSRGWYAHVSLPPPVKAEIKHWRTRKDVLLMPIRILDYPTLETMGDAGPIGSASKV